jgi:hopanoid-associated phosphorylase
MQEAPPHLPREARRAPVIAVCGLAFEAGIAAGPGVVTLCGLGSEQLAARLEELIARPGPPCRGIVSFGTAGGLDPALRPGTCVIAEAVVTPQARFPVDADWLQALRARLPAAIPGLLAGVDAPLADAAGKARLRQLSGACIVDMESHRAARIALRHGLPFAACRVVVDPAQRGLPPAALVGVREDGSTALLQILRALARQPGQLPWLMQLGLDAWAARQSLRAVRARLGSGFSLPPSRKPG